MTTAPEVIASCFIESIGTNVLFVKDLFMSSYDIIVCINDEFYYQMASHMSYPIDHIENVTHAVKNGLISIENSIIYKDKSHYSIIINGQHYYLYKCKLATNSKIQQFATENKWLFEDQGPPILK